MASHYLDAVMDIASECVSKVTSFVFPAGEESKNLNVVEDLYEHLIKEKFDRKDILLALGGGVVGDLTGFAASTYLRGIKVIQLPTTLLAVRRVVLFVCFSGYLYRNIGQKAVLNSLGELVYYGSLW